MWINFFNFFSNLNLNVFAFASAESSFPGTSPVRGGADNVALVGLSSKDGPYVGSVGALGMEFGGAENYYAHYLGAEWTLDCHGAHQEYIRMRELSLGIEEPFLAGYGGGGGDYQTDDESGGFLFLGGGALGEHVSVGVGAGAGMSNGPYMSVWGGAISFP